MTATVLDGKAYAKQMEAELAERVAKLKQDSGRTPILATILVGDDPCLLYTSDAADDCSIV